jgi:hypothetical protein
LPSLPGRGVVDTHHVCDSTTYRATRRPDRARKDESLSIEEVYNKGMTDRDHYYTQVEILKSDELARRVIEKLKL